MDPAPQPIPHESEQSAGAGDTDGGDGRDGKGGKRGDGGARGAGREAEPNVEIVDLPEESRYVLQLDGQRIGLMEYAVDGATFIAIHTEVDPAYSGRGLAQRLVTQVLDDVRDTGMALRPVCPYVRRFLTKHPEYDDLVA